MLPVIGGHESFSLCKAFCLFKYEVYTTAVFPVPGGG